MHKTPDLIRVILEGCAGQEKPRGSTLVGDRATTLGPIARVVLRTIKKEKDIKRSV